jgi:hypothetical protein
MLRPLADRLYQSPTRHDFVGRVFPADDAAPVDFMTEELILRVRPDCPVGSGDEMIDDAGRRLLLIDFDNTWLARTHRLVLLNKQTSWTRAGAIVDPVTNIKKGNGEVPLGSIWVSIQMLPRETSDGVINVKQDIRRVVTRHPLQLGDKVDGFVVQRVANSLGVTIAEAQ